jgi:hypothetical protein
MQLHTAIAPPRTEDVASQTFAIHPPGGPGFRDRALDEREMMHTVNRGTIKIQVKSPYSVGILMIFAFDQPLCAAMRSDQR